MTLWIIKVQAASKNFWKCSCNSPVHGRPGRAQLLAAAGELARVPGVVADEMDDDAGNIKGVPTLAYCAE